MTSPLFLRTEGSTPKRQSIGSRVLKNLDQVITAGKLIGWIKFSIIGGVLMGHKPILLEKILVLVSFLEMEKRSNLKLILLMSENYLMM